MKIKFFLAIILNVLFFACSHEKISPSPVDTDQMAVSNLYNAEVGTGGGGGGGVAICSPISSYTVKGDYRAGETGLSSIDASYAVKPCDKNQTVRVMIEIINFTTKAVLNSGDNLPLSGKYHFQGVGLYGLYTAKITVFDAVTNAVAGTQSFTVALKPKGV